MEKLLIIGFVWPEANSTAAGSRMMQLINFFVARKYAVTFASAAVKTEHASDLAALGVPTISIALNHYSFDAFIKRLHPNMVLFDRFLTEEQFGWRVTKNVPKAIRILDTEDLHSLRSVRYRALKEKQQFSVSRWKQDTMAKREVASIYRCDLSLLISSFEMELLKSSLKIDDALLLHLPFMLKKMGEKEINEWPSYENRTDFISIGNGKHSPNTDAICWLKKEIWPLIHRQLPKAALHIYGAYLPDNIRQMHQPKAGFYVHGRAENAHEVISRAKILLAPLRFGAGIKGKLTDAMVCGTPSITTSVGAEGMAHDLQWSGTVADTPDKFTQAAVSLYQNQGKWHQAQRNGVDIINGLYNKERLENRLQEKIASVKSNLEGFRTQNFIGAMLMHHTMASTKYMSKWIEAKNEGSA